MLYSEEYNNCRSGVFVCVLTFSEPYMTKKSFMRSDCQQSPEKHFICPYITSSQASQPSQVKIQMKNTLCNL